MSQKPSKTGVAPAVPKESQQSEAKSRWGSQLQFPNLNQDSAIWSRGNAGDEGEGEKNRRKRYKIGPFCEFLSKPSKGDREHGLGLTVGNRSKEEDCCRRKSQKGRCRLAPQESRTPVPKGEAEGGRNSRFPRAPRESAPEEVSIVSWERDIGEGDNVSKILVSCTSFPRYSKKNISKYQPFKSWSLLQHSVAQFWAISRCHFKQLTLARAKAMQEILSSLGLFFFFFHTLLPLFSQFEDSPNPPWRTQEKNWQWLISPSLCTKHDNFFRDW